MVKYILSFLLVFACSLMSYNLNAASSKPSQTVVSSLIWDKPIENVKAIIISPDGQSALFLGKNSVVLWSVKAGKKIANYRSNAKKLNDAKFDFNKNVIMGDSNGSIYHWNFKSNSLTMIKTGDEPVNTVATSKNNEFVAAGSFDGSVYLFSNKNLVKAWNIGVDAREMVFSYENDTLITAGADGKLSIWSIPSGKRINDFETVGGGMGGLKISPNGKTYFFYNAHVGAFLCCNDIETNREIYCIDGVYVDYIDVSSDGSIFITDGKKENQINLWSSGKRKIIKTLSLPAGRTIEIMALSPLGDYILAMDDQKLYFFNIR